MAKMTTSPYKTDNPVYGDVAKVLLLGQFFGVKKVRNSKVRLRANRLSKKAVGLLLQFFSGCESVVALPACCHMFLSYLLIQFSCVLAELT